MDKYSFNGHATKFGQLVIEDLRLETYADSPKKAESNFTAQTKQKLGLSYSAGGIKIHGEIKKM